ncbi:MAG: TetR/AcrR family transcriptional regulator [Rhizobiaceae bacterium]
MSADEISSRERILLAATELAREVGPAHISLDAVAARAGLSKGGLLYNFPSKKKLIEALVERHLEEFDQALRRLEAQHSDCGNALALALLELVSCEAPERKPDATGILAAIAEDPSFLDPIRRYRRDLLDRLIGSSSDLAAALIVFLAVDGLRSTQLFGTDALGPAEHAAVFAKLRDLLHVPAPA